MQMKINFKNDYEMNIKKEYIAPALRVVCFKVEMGSAASDPTPTSTLMFWQDEVDDQQFAAVVKQGPEGEGDDGSDEEPLLPGAERQRRLREAPRRKRCAAVVRGQVADFMCRRL